MINIEDEKYLKGLSKPQYRPISFDNSDTLSDITNEFGTNLGIYSGYYYVKNTTLKTKTFSQRRSEKMGRIVGFEPTHIGTTIRGLDHLTISATNLFSFKVLHRVFTLQIVEKYTAIPDNSYR